MRSSLLKTGLSISAGLGVGAMLVGAALAQAPQPAPAGAPAAPRPPPSTPGMPTLALPPNPSVPNIQYAPGLGNAANYAVYNIQPPPPKVPDGFTPIFNGRDLTGWHISQTAGHGHTPDFHVSQGMILGTQQPLGRGGILLTDKKYRNFELYLEAKADWGADSGIFIRTTEDGTCYQVTLDYLPGGGMGRVIAEGGLVGLGQQPGAAAGAGRAGAPGAGAGAPAAAGAGRGGAAPAAGAPAFENGMSLWKHNDWNSVRVRVEGDIPHIQVWINDKQTVDFTDTANHAVGGMVTAPFALQVHGGDARWVAGNFWRWRNIGVRELP